MVAAVECLVVGQWVGVALPWVEAWAAAWVVVVVATWVEEEATEVGMTKSVARHPTPTCTRPSCV